MKVAFGTVHGEEVNGWFFHSMLSLMGHTDIGSEDILMVRSGPLLSAGRGKLVNSFLENTDADALVMLDADMVFTPPTMIQFVETFKNMRATYENVGMLGGLAFISNDPRCLQPMPNLWSLNPQNPHQVMQQPGYAPDTLYEVAATGGACVIIAREVLEKLCDGQNPFHHVSLPNWHMLSRNLSQMDDPVAIEAMLKDHVLQADQLGEDLSFCYRVKQAGYRIFVHTGIKFDHAKSTLIGEPEFIRAIESTMQEDASQALPIPAPPQAPEAVPA